MYSNIVQQKHWQRISNLCRRLATLESQKLPQTSASSDGISPPPRIPRGPTDILQALAATVGRDPTAAHYKYHDDPYLIPLSNFRKRAYALSAEAGRKAAAWVRDEHAEWFTTREWDPPGKKKTPYLNADPFIDAFKPKPIYNDESQVTEEDLRYTIENALMEDSIKVFQLLGGAENISNDLKLQLLQLLCFYNEKEPDSLEWLEERWFAATSRQRTATTWKLGGLADKLFASMDPKTPEAYCAIIQGMAKYYQAERAHQLYAEAVEAGVPLSAGVFGALMASVGFLREGAALRIEALLTLLREMNEQGISPSVGTLSACLRSVSAWGGGRQLQQLALDLVAEFRARGVQPGLTAYYHMLCLFCKERGPRYDILSSILDDLESRDQLTAQEPTDTNFFITAMGICSDHLQDIAMAERVHALVLKGDNYRLVGDAYKESIYYRHYVTVACRHATFDRCCALLDTLIPNVYVPEPSVMEEIIKMLELNACGARLAQAWSQLVVFGHARKHGLGDKLLAAMSGTRAGQDEEVQAQMRAAAADMLRFGESADQDAETKDMRSPIQQQLSASALSNIIEICSSSDDKSDSSWEAVEGAVSCLQRGAVGGAADPAVLSAAAEKAATIGKHGTAAAIVSYLSEFGFPEAVECAERVLCAMLHRPPSDVAALLHASPAPPAHSLHPAAQAVIQAYHTASGGGGRARDDTSSSSDSSDSSSDDE